MLKTILTFILLLRGFAHETSLLRGGHHNHLIYQHEANVGDYVCADGSIPQTNHINYNNNDESMVTGLGVSSSHRSLRSEESTNDTTTMNTNVTTDDSDSVTILTQSMSFQIAMSVILGLVALVQITLLSTFIRHRSKRVLEFAQPFIICIFITCGIATTCACYLFIYTSNIGCAVREPIIFISLSLMGSTIAGRAWRITTLINSPLLTMGRGIATSRIERARQITLQILTIMSGNTCCNVVQGRGSSGGGKPLRVTVTVAQMIRTIILLVLPQTLLQIVILSVPTLRSSESISYYDDFGVIKCQASIAIGSSWQLYVSIVLALLPYCCAYLLNIRTKSELDQLPDIIDERERLKESFAILLRVLVICAPMIGLTMYSPSAHAYGTICAVLGLPLALCYHIAYIKLVSTTTNTTQQKRRLSNVTGGRALHSDEQKNSTSSASFAVKMSEMYLKIGRTEETVQLVEETLSVWKKGGISTTGLPNLTQHQSGREEVGESGFTKHDLKALEPEELQLIIKLLKIKGNALTRLHGPSGFEMSARINIDALKIWEHCPAAAKMNDISIIFPIYNLVSIQMKGGVIDQDDMCSLENDLAEKYVHEAQVEVFHYARALANQAEWYGRCGQPKEAFKYFTIMKSVYMPTFHPKLLSNAYSVDRCAVCFATSALWFLQMGDIEGSIEQCDFVINEILPNYDKEDVIGMYDIFIPLIRVLKWNKQVDKARTVYCDNAPEGVESHFAVGSVHKPILLLLRICHGSTEEYNTVKEEDIDLALQFDCVDITSNIMTCNGWSMKSLAAELCLHLARRLTPGNADRKRLINRGIQQATIADERVSASNGMIKHIMAYQAHSEIQKGLLALACEDVAVSRNIIYENGTKGNDGSLSSCSGKKSVVSLANRFVISDSSTKNTSNGSNGVGNTSQVVPKKKVAFSPMHVSSLESHGSAASKHSNDSQQEGSNS